jgi:DNA-binding SARP family transcriptional activator
MLVEFGILGPLQLMAGASDLDIGGGKRRGLVARLLIDANRVVHTDRLVEDLWTDGAVGAAATVQTYVSRLRKLLDPGRVVTRGPGYMIVVQPGELDADRFGSLVLEAHDVHVAPADAVALLEEAESLWRGPALVEFAAFAWAKPTAERLRRRRIDATGDRIEALIHAGRAGEAASELEAMVEREPLDERSWQLLVVAHYRCGRQAEALRVYQRARSVLIDQLGVEPGPALRSLEVAVLNHDPSLDAPVAEAFHPQPPTRAPRSAGAGSRAPREAPDTLSSDLSWVPPALTALVGREDVMDKLVGAIDSATGGQGRLVLVDGEPGAGKTRLLAEVAQRAEALGCLCLYGRCDEDASVPYQPFVTALDPLIATVELDLGALAADLAQVFPELDSGDVETPPGLDPESRRHRLFEAFDRALRTLARHRVVVVFIDDLQWADLGVLRLLRHLAGRLAHRRAVVVAAFCGAAALPSDPLQAQLLNLRRHLPVVDVFVSSLTHHDIAALLGHWMADDQRVERTRLAQRLRRDTSGNALFVTEIVRDLFRERSAERFPDDRVPELPLPVSVAEIVALRVAHLPPTTQRFLTAAAVIGLTFEFAVAAEVADLDADHAMDVLDEAIGQGIVTETTAGRFAFSHGMVRRALYARLAAPRRVRLHLAVARALQRRDPGLCEIEGLARHLGAGAGDDAVAVREAAYYAQLAGDRAIEQLSYETAICHYRRALDLLRSGGDESDDHARCEVLLALGRALNQAGDIEEAKERLLEATAIATSRREPSVVASAALAFGGVLQAGVGIGDRRGITLMHQAIAALGPDDTIERALLLGRLAHAEYWRQPREVRSARCAEAVAIARRIGDPRAIATVLVNRYWALEGPDDVEARLRSSAEAERIAIQLGDVDLAMQAGKCRLHVLLSLDSWDEALRQAERLRRQARATHQPEHQRLALSFDAVVAGNAGRFDEAERLATQARELLSQLGRHQHGTIVRTVQLQPWRWLQARLDEQIERLEHFVRREPDRATWRALLAWAHAEGGDPAQAARQLNELDLSRRLGAEHNFDFWLVAVPSAIAAVRLGDEPTAKLLHDALRMYGNRNAFVGQIAFLGCVEHHVGALALLLGHDSAARTLQRAVERYQAMGAVAYAAHASRLLAAAR